MGTSGSHWAKPFLRSISQQMHSKASAEDTDNIKREDRVKHAARTNTAGTGDVGGVPSVHTSHTHPVDFSFHLQRWGQAAEGATLSSCSFVRNGV